MPCSNIEGTVEIPLAEYNRLREIEVDYIKAGDQYHKGQEYMAEELLREIERTGYNPSVGASAMASGALKTVVGILRQVKQRAE